MLKVALAGLLSAALIILAPQTQATPANLNNSITAKPAQAQTVRAAVPEKAAVAKPTAQTKPKTVIEPEPVKPTNGCQTYRQLVEQYDWNARIMLAVMQAESGCNPNAISPVNYDGVRDYGLMQLHGQYILEPSQNVAAAYRLWKVQGYQAWSAYNNGSYGQFY